MPSEGSGEAIAVSGPGAVVAAGRTTATIGAGWECRIRYGDRVLGVNLRWMPVSTTHVSCGALFGIGATTGEARWGTIGGVFTAWVTTLPLAAVLAAAIMPA